MVPVESLGAQPEPEGLTLEELNDLCADHGFVFDDNNGEGLSILSDIVKAVLARWGRSTPQPVSVSERLPGPEDCDAAAAGGWVMTDPRDLIQMSDYQEAAT